MSGSDNFERRKASRYSVSDDGKVPLKLERHDSIPVEAQLVSLSEQGARFRVGSALRLSEVVRLHLDLPILDVSLEIHSTIIWSQPTLDATWMVGCAFDTAIPKDVVDRLAGAGLVDRRVHERFPIDVPGMARWQSDEDTSSITIRDYSVGGFCIECDTLHAVGANMRIQFESGESICGEVRWSSKAGTKFLHGCDFMPVRLKDNAGANTLRKLNSKLQGDLTATASGPRFRTKGVFEWIFAATCGIACAVSIYELLRTLKTGSPNATAFSIAYATTTFLCLLGSALPFVRAKAEGTPTAAGLR